MIHLDIYIQKKLNIVFLVQDLMPSNKYIYFRKENKGWRLDYFIINKEAIDAIIVSDINLAVEGSDHVPIECEVDLRKL